MLSIGSLCLLKEKEISYKIEKNDNHMSEGKWHVWSCVFLLMLLFGEQGGTWMLGRYLNCAVEKKEEKSTNLDNLSLWCF